MNIGLNYFYSNDFSATINFIILALFLFALARTITIFNKIRREKKAIQTISEAVHNLLHNLPLPGLDNLVSEVDDSTICKRRFAEYQKIRFNGKELTPEILDGVNQNIAFPDTHSARRIAGVLVLLGLLGTLLGLSYGVTQMQNLLLDQQNFSAISQSMLSFIQGMSTAFSTTLAGIVGTLLLVFAIFYVDKHKLEVERLFEVLLLSHIYPIYSFTHKSDDLSEIKDIIKDTKNVIEQITRDTRDTNEDTRQMFLRMNSSVMSLSKSIENISDPFRHASKIQEQMIGLLEKIESGLGETLKTNSQISRSILEFTEKTGSLITQTSISVETMKVLSGDNQMLRELIRENSEKSSYLADKLSDIMFEAQEVNNSLKNILPEMTRVASGTLNAVKSEIIEYVDQLNKNIDSIYNAYVSQIRESSLDVSKTISNEFGANLERVTRQLESIKNDFNDSIEMQYNQASDLVDKNSRILRELLDDMQRFEAQTRAESDSYNKELGLLIQKTKDLMEELSENIKTNQMQFLKTLSETQVILVEDVRNRIESLNQEQNNNLSLLIDKLNIQQSQTHDNLPAMNDVNDNLEAMKINLKTLEQSVNQHFEVLEKSANEKKQGFSFFGGKK